MGPEYQLVFELRPAHDPTKAYGFVNCVISLKDLSSSIWTWHRDGDKWAITKIIDIPAEPADPDKLPPILKGFKAVPPFVTDIDLSMDDRFLYVACWGTGDVQQYDVSDPFKPKLTGKVRIGGVVSRASHPGAKNGALSGAPQMVEISRDGKRVYFTNSLYGNIDSQLYPDGMDGWMVKPADFDSTKKYPVVFYVYTEPAATTVNDSYGGQNNFLFAGKMERSWRASPR